MTTLRGLQRLKNLCLNFEEKKNLSLGEEKDTKSKGSWVNQQPTATEQNESIRKEPNDQYHVTKGNISGSGDGTEEAYHFHEIPNSDQNWQQEVEDTYAGSSTAHRGRGNGGLDEIEKNC